MTDVKWITQQKTVVERVCSDVPDQECKINTVIQDKPVNSTECKIVKENKCSIITVPTKEKECRKVFEKKCRTVSEIVTSIVQVREAFKKFWYRFGWKIFDIKRFLKIQIFKSVKEFYTIK